MTASDEPQLATRSGVVLRRARRDDLAEIVGLLRDDPLGSARETADLASYAAAYATIEADPAQLLVVVAAGGGLVGTAQLSLIPGLTYQGGTRGQVEGVRVRADRRGQGLGGWLVGWLVEEARRRGCVLVQLTSDSAAATPAGSTLTSASPLRMWGSSCGSERGRARYPIVTARGPPR